MKRKYPQPYSLRKYFSYEVIDRIHNQIKHEGKIDMKKYQVYLKSTRRKSNGHKTSIYR